MKVSEFFVESFFRNLEEGTGMCDGNICHRQNWNTGKFCFRKRAYRCFDFVYAEIMFISIIILLILLRTTYYAVGPQIQFVKIYLRCYSHINYDATSIKCVLLCTWWCHSCLLLLLRHKAPPFVYFSFSCIALPMSPPLLSRQHLFSLNIFTSVMSIINWTVNSYLLL